MLLATVDQFAKVFFAERFAWLGGSAFKKLISEPLHLWVKRRR